jgi:hypothetical protein
VEQGKGFSCPWYTMVLDGVLTRDGFVQKPGGVGEYCMPRIPIKNNSEPAVDQVVTIV